MSSSPTVLVFRKRLLAFSETFIADQGKHLPNWRAVFTGVTEDQSGQSLLTDCQQSLLTTATRGISRLLGPQLFKRLGSVPRAWLSELQAEQPRLIHAHFGPDGMAAIPLAKALGIPLIVTFHGFDICISKPKNYYRKNRDIVFNAADKIIAVSDFIRTKLIADGCPPEKICVHYIGIDLEKFKAEAGPRKNILFVGRLAHKKGVHVLLEAMQHLADDISLDIIGSGPLLDELTEKATQLPNTINFLGRKTPQQVAAAMRQAAVFCGPSTTPASGDAEGLGMVFLEAQAVRTPVVATLHGGIVSAVKNGYGGLLVPENDAPALAKALEQILDNPDRAEEMGSNGESYVHEHFNVRKQCEKLEAIYESVIAR